MLLTNAATLLTGFGLFGSFLLIPQLAESDPADGFGFGASATHAGLLMLPGSVIMLDGGRYYLRLRAGEHPQVVDDRLGDRGPRRRSPSVHGTVMHPSSQPALMPPPPPPPPPPPEKPPEKPPPLENPLPLDRGVAAAAKLDPNDAANDPKLAKPLSGAPPFGIGWYHRA